MNKIVLFLMAFILAFSSCKRYTSPPSYNEEYQIDTSAKVKKKILIIGIDGAVGAEYKTLDAANQIPALSSLKTQSKYSWESVSDEVTSDASSWKTILSGVYGSKHKIYDSSCVFTVSGGSDQDVVSYYPSMFNYILSSPKAYLKTSFISSWPTMVNRLAPEVKDKVFAANDATVKDSALNRITNGSADIVIVHFNAPAIAGKTSGFSSSVNDYKNAVVKTDGYIGEIMTALKARPQYNKGEEWLVIIAGTHGGYLKTYGGSTGPEANNFAFYYTEGLKSLSFFKGAYSNVQMRGKGDVVAQVEDDGGLYNPGTEQQTVSVKVKVPGPSAYPVFFSKQLKAFNGTGWCLFTNSAGRFCMGVNTRKFQTPLVNFCDNQWHTLTFIFKDTIVSGATKHYFSRYMDGIFIADPATDRDISTLGSITSTTPLTMGWFSDQSQGGLNLYFADCMIFNTALSDAEVAGLVCTQDITTHPKYNNIIGYWRCNDGFGARFSNFAPIAAGNTSMDLKLKGKFTWDGFEPNSAPCSVPAFTPTPIDQTMLIQNVDIARTVMYWFNIPINAAWTLDGNAWLGNYAYEYVK